ncbi:MAG: ABC transporter ATP-binding protein [Coriobacteriia bacterium]|nr:ABC transporter ATP-binding protein [Coriobacteriia bacterium]
MNDDTCKQNNKVALEYAVEVSQLTKRYKIYPNDIKRALGTLGFKVEHKDFVALDNINYKFEKGEVTAILGRNGSGKSTLLKLITGVTFPNKGTVETHGRISAMLELRSGFDAELTGIENIYYKALTMGISEAEIEQVKDDIIEFADIGVHIDQPYRTYSSGMKARLGFAVAANIDPDILVVDEVMAVGDDIFKMKCIAKMNEFRQQGKTILFVSHSMSTVKAFCTRAIWLNQGKLMAQGDMGDVVVQYSEFLKTERKQARVAAIEQSEEENPILTRRDIVAPTKFRLLDDSGESIKKLDFGKPWAFAFNYEVKKPMDSLAVAFSISNAEGVEVYSSGKQSLSLDRTIGKHKARIQFEEASLIPGKYQITVELWDNVSGLKVLAANAKKFNVAQTAYVGTGIVHLKHSVAKD